MRVPLALVARIFQLHTPAASGNVRIWSISKSHAAASVMVIPLPFAKLNPTLPFVSVKTIVTLANGSSSALPSVTCENETGPHESPCSMGFRVIERLLIGQVMQVRQKR
jgi:hypothetical protein